MKKLLLIVCLSLFLLVSGCSDGTQVGQKLETIISERLDDKDPTNDIKQLIIIMDDNRTEYEMKQFIIDGQFIVIGNESINLGRTKTIKEHPNSIEITM